MSVGLPIFLAAAVFAGLTACSHQGGRLDPRYCTASPAAQKIGAFAIAGCLIKIDGKAVLVDDKGTGLFPPGGHPEIIAGKKEAAWQTACRETQEEAMATPIHVEKLLYNFGEKFYLFHCSLSKKAVEKFKRTPTFEKQDGDPLNQQNIIKVFLKDPHATPKERWRFPDQRGRILSLFDQLP